MLDDNPNDNPNDNDATTGGSDSGGSSAEGASAPPVVKKTTRKSAPRKAATTRASAAGTAAEPAAPVEPAADVDQTAAAPTVKRTTRTRSGAAKKAVASPAATVQDALIPETADSDDAVSAPVAKKAPARKTAAKKAAAAKTTAPRTPAAKKTAAKKSTKKSAEPGTEVQAEAADATEASATESGPASTAVPLFQAPVVVRRTRSAGKKAAAASVETDAEALDADAAADAGADTDASTADAKPARKTAAGRAPAKRSPASRTAPSAQDEDVKSETGDDENDADNGDGTGPARRRRRRGGRRRRKGGDGSSDTQDSDTDNDTDDEADTEDAATKPGDTRGNDNDDGDQGDGTSRRRRRRRRAGEEGDETDNEPNTVTRVRSRRSAEDQITAVAGSTRLEAKKQRRREGREAGRRRAPIVSEAEFLARRESVDRVMVIRQRKELTQIAVLEDKVLVEHYVARESQTSLIGNVYLGRVQNVLPSMEAAFIDIGKGRNAVLYAGEVNWAALGHKDGQTRKIESVLSSGQSVLVQVTKDPVGHKGARLTSQVSLAGRFLVYVPDGTTSGISRKLPDTERNRLKTLLKEIVPDTAGVIVRTAAEGASEDELTHDVERLKARWDDIDAKAKGQSPQLLYGEPDLTLKVVRDLFTEDFAKLVIEGDDAWDTVQGYVAHVAPDLQDRLEKFEPANEGRGNGKDVFAAYRIEEQIQKGLDRKVWLPSGGSLVIDRTEAMTVVDVNTGKFTGSGGNLEETVTKNNLEAAEEMVRQLRLRDIGGIIVIDFIDMVLESNRDLVVRRLVECLGRDRTRHQVAEVTSLGLVQMTRKRIGTGLLEAFSTDCDKCHGRGVVITSEPVEPQGEGDEGDRRATGRRSRGRGRGEGQESTGDSSGNGGSAGTPSPKDVAAMPRSEKTDHGEHADHVEEAVATESTSAEKPRESPIETPATPELDAPAAEAPAIEEPEVEVEQPKVDASAAEAPGAAEPEPAEVAEPTKPQVVTRTRRRSATRPAGPPVLLAVGAAGRVPQTGIEEPGTADVEPGVDPDDAPHIEHVPIKKRGTRKR
ncbi:Rne/Rng family ribonuclease [Nocardioides sp.]|uniref:Rne/Rng family ribonuclease n=1 Tax=Nocardioides sp. TaxID=35761 RepID=UPI00286DC17E|nr:Rne/Rng family ribonuclease [Nocardioides sp.]